MSLIIHAIIREGIVAAADSRATISTEEDGVVRYDDTIVKTVPFPNMCVVSYCGEAMLTATLSVYDFLTQLRKNYGTVLEIFEIPAILLQEFLQTGSDSDVTFLASGIVKATGQPVCYRIHPQTREILLYISPGERGATYEGCTELTHVIMNNYVDFNHLSLTEAAQFAKKCMDFNIEMAKYQEGQPVGGITKIYLIDKNGINTGWLNKKGNVVKDKNAPDNTFDDDG